MSQSAPHVVAMLHKTLLREAETVAIMWPSKLAKLRVWVVVSLALVASPTIMSVPYIGLIIFTSQ